MKKRAKISLILGIIFIVYTLLVCFIDRTNLYGGQVGWSKVNAFFFDLLNPDPTHQLAKITNFICYFSFISLAIMGSIMIYQWIKGKSLAKVDHFLYGVVFAGVILSLCYIASIFIPISLKPINGVYSNKTSYPSSHLLFTFYNLGSLTLYLRKRNPKGYLWLLPLLITDILSVVIIMGRLFTAYHWVTDIIGSIILVIFLLSLEFLFESFLDEGLIKYIPKKKDNPTSNK